MSKIDWKREAVECLRKYRAHSQSLVNLADELRRLETELASLRSADLDKIQANGSGKQHEDAILSNMINHQLVSFQQTQARLWAGMVDRALDALTDAERQLLDRMYINRVKGGVDQLCSELYLEQSSVYRRRESALRNFTKALCAARGEISQPLKGGGRKNRNRPSNA